MATLQDPRHERLLQWLCTAPQLREPKTYEQLGASMEPPVARRTLFDWRNRPEFRAEWEERAIKIAGDPERTQRVLDALYEVATDTTARNQVSAAKTWADIAGVVKPPKVEEKKLDTNSLTAQEVDELILELLATKEPDNV